MKKKVTYEAADGKLFDNEIDCFCYERKLIEKQIWQEDHALADLDEKIRGKYGSAPSDEEIPPNQAYIWLKADTEDILAEADENTFETVKKDIYQIISSDTYGKDFLKKYKDDIELNISIRRDFDTAFKTMTVTNIVENLEYMFSKRDLARLAVIHKSGKCRRKIEDILTAANFHTECSDFCSRDYDKYIDDLA